MQKRWEIGIGLVGFSFAVVALLFWFPNDIKRGFMELSRTGKLEAGDAFFPTLLAYFIAFFSLIQIVIGFVSKTEDNSTFRRITFRNLTFLSTLIAIILISLGITYWLGPLIVHVLGAAESYRLVIDTFPYKYVGFIAGGFSMTFALITWAEGRVRSRTIIASMLMLIALIIVFDVALTNIQLPPNADY